MVTSLTFKIIVIGRLKHRYLQEGVQDFLKRIRPFAHLEIVELRGLPHSEKWPAEELKAREGALLLKEWKSDAYRIALDPRGKLLSTEEWAEFFRRLPEEGKRAVAFCIGGELGLSQEVLEAADAVWSLSPLTFTHDMTRLILLEQLYRVMTILAGQRYHK
ncbi:MAG TPA: 23S rRNA (pseudouridine(1915)-N(3))-methyltransferase RlmH [Bacteroidetes bacterium]|nr:23S rRNA (pseudouridine(1915)-N(3))-methyltransferase RlmH [Bacteroidota bacterium]